MILSDLYDAQPLFVEKLPGTHEFRVLCNKYRYGTGDFDISDDAIWQKLNAMRKRGELNAKSDKTKRIVVETWGPLVGKKYIVPVAVGHEEICMCVAIWLKVGGLKPVTRLECWNIVKSGMVADAQVEVGGKIIEDAIKIVDHLFPELRS